MSHQNPHPEELPDRLVEDLTALYGRSVPVPRHVDRAVLAAARARMARGHRLRLVLYWSSAAAAVLAIAIGVGLLQRQTPSTVAPPILARAEDVDQNGRVDVLDAYLLARRVELAQKLKQEWDFNHDGKVDRGDANLVAQSAVRLEEGPVR